MTVAVEIGGTQTRIETGDELFTEMLHRRYADFIGGESPDPISLQVNIVKAANTDSDLSVTLHHGTWQIARGDFEAAYDPGLRRGTVRQTANPWSIDAVIRIVHSLELASRRGFLIHAASAVRNGRAFIFAGPSGAGKTTISRLAPTSVTLLTDEISYLRESGDCFIAWGTPFAGELGKSGDNTSAPVQALYFLEHAAHNRIVPLDGAEALRCLMKNILFFADDPELVRMVFETAAEFLRKTEVFRLAFALDADVWNLIE